MRTAVLRINIDPDGTLDPAQLERGMSDVRATAAAAGMAVIRVDLAAFPSSCRELEILAAGDDAAALQQQAIGLCALAFSTPPRAATTTFLSRGTDEDAAGLLAGFGISGVISREPGPHNWDVVTVRLVREGLRRVPESRIQTALEASLNCEVRIIAE